MADSRWSKYLATGVRVNPGEDIPTRQEFRDFAKEPKNLHLYFEGLKKFQAVDAKDPLSYYQIAGKGVLYLGYQANLQGIHGRPFEKWPDLDWNQDIEKKATGKSDFGGFCTHSSILFLTWHRPYLALFESALYGHVQEVARKISRDDSGKQTYVQLAQQFRIPYWDWARRDAQVVPKQALESAFRGSRNPLFDYPFPESTPDEITWGEQSTSRSTDFVALIKKYYDDPSITWDNLPVPQKWDQIPIVIPENNLTERTAWILQAYKTFPAMSNNRLRTGKAGEEDRTNWGSLEDVHNAIHSLTGGHMGSTEVSAFDPIFWLHHANIDRLYDIWQALHEDDGNQNAFVLPRKAGEGGFSTKKGDEETIDSWLYPFRPDIKSKESWYTSRLTGNTKAFGYTYPETAGLKYPTSETDRKKLLADIGGKYDSLPKFIQQSKQRIPTAGQDLLAGANFAKQIQKKTVPATAASISTLIEKLPDSQTLLKTSLEPSKPLIRDLAPDNKYLEWLTNIKAEKHSMDGDYTVHIFLGPADDETNVALWPAAPTHVGTFSPFGQPRGTSCSKCQEEQEAQTLITGQIPLTLALVERYLAGIIPDLTEASVKPYLTKELHWRVAKGDGTKVEDQSQVGSLKVLVISNEVTVPEDISQLPIYAPDVTVYPEITSKLDGTGRGNGTGLVQDEL